MNYKWVFYIILLIIKSIKSDSWFDAVNGYDTTDNDWGYAGGSKNPMIDFYLCSKRQYRVHFLGDDKNNWSQIYTNCDPVGNGRFIDGITISGEEQYMGRTYLSDNWQIAVIGFNISNEEYVGDLNNPLACIAVDGEEYYRTAFYRENENEIKS